MLVVECLDAPDGLVERLRVHAPYVEHVAVVIDRDVAAAILSRTCDVHSQPAARARALGLADARRDDIVRQI